MSIDLRATPPPVLRRSHKLKQTEPNKIRLLALFMLLLLFGGVKVSEAETRSLTTTFADGNSLVDGGNMFDITAAGEEIVVTALDINTSATGLINVEVYYKPGTYSGFEQQPSAWTSLGMQTVTGAGANNPTPLTINGLRIPAGQTYGLYVRLSGGSIRYTNLQFGDPSTYSNGDLRLDLGVSVSGVFGNYVLDRIWNGTVYYEKAPFTFNVNNTADAGDANLSDGLCDTNLSQSGQQCSLRAAVEQANALPGNAVINLASWSDYALTRGQLTITSDIIIHGSSSTVRNASGNARIFQISNTGRLSLTKMNVADGRPGAAGGAILVDSGGALNVLNSSFVGNAASSFGGGAIYSSGTLNIANTTFANNTSLSDGGGLRIAAGIANLSHVTLFNNTADADDNNSGEGGGISAASGTTVNVKNTLIANNKDLGGQSPDLNGVFTSQGYNFVGNKGTATFTSGSSDQVGTAAAPLNPSLFGGATGVPAFVPLAADSPAINKIPLANCTYISVGANPLFSSGGLVTADQRGVARPQQAACDVGARELHIVSVSSAADAITADSICTLREAITAANTSTAFNGCAGAPDILTLPASTYTLSLNGSDDTNATGDLDVAVSLVLAGSATADTTLQAGVNSAAGIDRILDVVDANATVQLSKMTVQHGRTGGDGGGLRSSGGLLLVQVSVENNKGSRGGGIYTSGALTLQDSTLQGNEATSEGGGIYSQNTGTVTLINTILSGNTSSQRGGAIFNNGLVNITGSTLSSNISSVDAGGIYSNGTTNIFKSALLGNVAGDDAGAIQTGVGSFLNIANSTVADNRANDKGGGFYNFGVASLTHVTVAENTADNDNAGGGDGGGIYQSTSGSFTLRNTIIARNIDRSGQMPDIHGTITSAGYNIIGNVGSQAYSSSAGDQVGTGSSPIEPYLESRTGAPAYFPLQSSSPALDAVGENNCTYISSGVNPLFTHGSAVTEDQRGAVRPSDSNNDGLVRCDIGAIEELVAVIEVLHSGNPLTNQTGSVSFGLTSVGTPVVRTLTIRNLGSDDLTIYEPLSLPNGFKSAGFSARTLAPTESMVFQIQLDASQPGLFGGYVSFSHSDQKKSPFIFSIAGEVSSADVRLFEGSKAIDNGKGSSSFGTVLLNSTAQKTFTVRNTGDTELTVSNLSLPPGIKLVRSFGENIIPAGGETTFIVALDTSSVGSKGGSVTFRTNDPSAITYSFDLGGIVQSPTGEQAIIYLPLMFRK